MKSPPDRVGFIFRWKHTFMNLSDAIITLPFSRLTLRRYVLAYNNNNLCAFAANTHSIQLAPIYLLSRCSRCVDFQLDTSNTFRHRRWLACKSERSMIDCPNSPKTENAWNEQFRAYIFLLYYVCTYVIIIFISELYGELVTFHVLSRLRISVSSC